MKVSHAGQPVDFGILRREAEYPCRKAVFTMDTGHLSAENEAMLCKGGKSAVVFMDAWDPGRKERKLTEAELLPGELTAVVFPVGCYLVRSAERVCGQCIVQEISARHTAAPGNAFVEVCRIPQPADGDGCGYIGDIYAVREQASVPDEAASLIVYSHYEGRSSGADTWYQFTADGKITKSEEFPFPAETEKLWLGKNPQGGDQGI